MRSLNSCSGQIVPKKINNAAFLSKNFRACGARDVRPLTDYYLEKLSKRGHFPFIHLNKFRYALIKCTKRSNSIANYYAHELPREVQTGFLCFHKKNLLSIYSAG